ncbi:cell division protein ZapA [Treponema endosymbiont of Eucomonympha sp.]|uniref:cell division protein ZapA n=1 Tax=Treponema endosymbiont of Eucomonympha sp. TaxID=1580831 RepID=UPI001650BD89|nr:cell division protein ZapA [Treponema endosymbiont of Eucomonympha sp.]
MRIDVLGALFSVEAREDSQHLEFLLDNYKKMVHLVENSSGATITNSLQVAILSGIMLCDELYKEKKLAQIAKQIPLTEELIESERLTLRMIEKIDRALLDNLDFRRRFGVCFPPAGSCIARRFPRVG